MKYKSRLTGRNRTMLTAANDSMRLSRNKRRIRELSHRLFLLSLAGSVFFVLVHFMLPLNNQSQSESQSREGQPALPIAPALLVTAPPVEANEKLKQKPVPRLPVAAPAPVAPQPVATLKVATQRSPDHTKTNLEIPKPEVVSPTAGARVQEMAQAVREKAPVSIPGTDPVLAKKMLTLFSDYDVPEAAVAVVDISSGEVLTAIGYQNGNLANHKALEARWPAASIFKIVTAAALLENGVRSDTEMCFNGGFRPVTAADLRATSGGTCASMKTAFSRSYNVPFARWSNAHLSQATLLKAAHQFGFHRPQAFGLSQASVGKLEIPGDKLERAGTAAGFGKVHLSALHGALIAGAVANGGVVVKPKWELGGQGDSVRILRKDRAEAIRKMMVSTVSSGTARRTFKEGGKPVFKKLGAGGKTGTLAHQGRDLSWFVGFAPAEKPRYAVGVYVANRPTWRIRAPYVGREALRSALLKTSPYRPPEASLASR